MPTPQKFFTLDGEIVRPNRKHGDPQIFQKVGGEVDGITAYGLLLFSGVQTALRNGHRTSRLLDGNPRDKLPELLGMCVESLFVIERKVKEGEVTDHLYNVFGDYDDGHSYHILIVVRQLVVPIGMSESKIRHVVVGISRPLGREETRKIFTQEEVGTYPANEDPAIKRLLQMMEAEQVGAGGQTRFWPTWLDTVGV